jgi:glycosyltransferase involved in cell wall biosynthesis
MPTADTYCTPEEFTAKLAAILETDWDAPENRKRLEKGREWVLEHYGWEAILKEFSEAIHDTPRNPQTNR